MFNLYIFYTTQNQLIENGLLIIIRAHNTEPYALYVEPSKSG